MKLTLEAEQEFLQDTTRRFLAKQSSIARTRELVDAGGPRYDTELWRRACTELGLAGLVADPDHGGSGSGWTEAAVAVEELGAAVDGSPLLSTTVAIAALEAAGPVPAGGLVPRLVEGDLVAAVMLLTADEATVESTDTGRLRITATAPDVMNAPDADVLVVIVSAPGASYVAAIEVGADGVAVEQVEALDLTRRFGHVRLTAAEGDGAAIDHDAALRLRDGLQVLVAAELSGLVRAFLQLTTDYLRTRVAFGRTIGSFQAVKHRLAEMYCELELVQSAVRAATWAIDAGAPEAPLEAAVAFRAATARAVDVTTECLRLTGGIGYTWEHDAHVFVRRAHQDQALLGGRGRVDRELLALVTSGPVTPGEFERGQ